MPILNYMYTYLMMKSRMFIIISVYTTIKYQSVGLMQWHKSYKTAFISNFASYCEHASLQHSHSYMKIDWYCARAVITAFSNCNTLKLVHSVWSWTILDNALLWAVMRAYIHLLYCTCMLCKQYSILIATVSQL